ncbi:MAG TPA: glutaredoxin family protein [Burkholderiales bacterium]
MTRLLLIALALLALPAAAGSLYRWVDADGKVHYTDTPPPATAKDVKQQTAPGQAAEPTRLPYATQVAVKNFPVTLYATDCGEACTKGRDLLRKRGIPFTDKDPQQPAEQQELSKLLSGQLEVPVLKVGSSVNRGFSEEQWHTVLDAAGYPKNAGAPPPPPKAAPKAETKPAAEAAPPEPAPARRGPYPVYSD